MGANHWPAVRLDIDDWRGKLPVDAGNLVNRALAFWGNPSTTASTRAALTAFAETALADADSSWKRAEYPVLVVNALRVPSPLPDYQTC
jgi:hypothetical protein